ncbi:hypothetical protein [Variovorax sp.]|jgi:hypothetical protein|uniref:hypothetical protein n=1 Tax=Variovorax sp. TaxID=1871043 RepID=UPI0040382E8C
MSEQLDDDGEMLFRQIHPACLVEGVPGSDRFMPSLADGGFLSVDRASKTTPEESHALYTRTGKLSAAVFGLTVGEFSGEAIPCRDAPTKESETHPENPAHALADYSGHESKRHKNIAKRLKRLALVHGQLFPPPATGDGASN